MVNHYQKCICAVGKPAPACHALCAMGRFHNLRHVTIHVEVDKFRIRYMDPAIGNRAVSDVYEFIQQRKCGLPLLRLELVFGTFTSNLFGYRDFPSRPERVTMTCKSGGGYNSNLEDIMTCDDPSFGKVLESRKRAAERGGLHEWERHIGPYLWKWRQGERSLPTLRQLEWFIRIILPPQLSTITRYKNTLPETSTDKTPPSRFWHQQHIPPNFRVCSNCRSHQSCHLIPIRGARGRL